jgi:hypothetical protein
MAMRFSIDRTRDLTVFTLTGEIALSEFIDCLHSYIDNQPTFYEIYDVRELSGSRFSKEEVGALALFLEQRVAKRPSGGKTAVIVDKNIDYGLSRMVSMLTDGRVPYTIEVFKSIDAAHQWLDET